MKHTLVTVLCTISLSLSSQAEQLWSDTSISVLYGSDYEFFPDESLTTLTLEHVSGHSWGKLFYFIDRHNGAGFSESYSEFSPTLTLKKMDGLISSINAAFTYEFGTVDDGQNLNNYLFGINAGFNIPHLDFASATFFYADNDDKFNKGNTDYQLTLVYGYSHGNLIIDGFMDYAFSNDNDGIEDSMNFTPQITYNIGPSLGIKNKVKVGIEYSYWVNQFGVDSQDQNALSLLVKFHL